MREMWTRWKRSLWDAGEIGHVYWKESNEDGVCVGRAVRSLDSRTILV